MSNSTRGQNGQQGSMNENDWPFYGVIEDIRRLKWENFCRHQLKI